jgi:putative membrane protein
VPLLIPLAWLMMFPAAWAVAYRIVGRWGGVPFVIVSALAMTAWDLFLDPQMVAWGLWTWAEPGGYFGIPWQNYLGWLLATALITAAVRPGDLPTGPFLLIYIVTWLLETIGLLFFWGLPGPALVGFVGMGSLIWLARQQRRS